MTQTPTATTDANLDTPETADGKIARDGEMNTTPAVLEPNNALSEHDYDAIAGAVMETERGRWFLAEYARRNRQSDTQTVLDALSRLEDRIGEAKPAVSGDASVALLSHNVIDLAEAITQVKREVQELGGQGDKGDHFNTATEELEAIVAQTETATGEILEAAEKVQEVLWILREEGASETQCDIVESKIIDIYTACSFQDLTGQRSSKVVRLVSYVEKRVASMMEILGLADPTDASKQEASSAGASEDDTPNMSAYQEGDERSDAHLLHGPTAEGNEQDDVDALFDSQELPAEDAQSSDEHVDTITADADPTLEDTEFEAVAVLEEAMASEQSDHPGEVDIFSNDSIVEIHDAEVLLQPAATELADAALENTAQLPDIFEVDQLDFDGPDMTAPLEPSEDQNAYSGRSRTTADALRTADLPGTFSLDEPASDMFMDDPIDDEQSKTVADATGADMDGLIEPEAHNDELEQDIFAVDVFEPDSSASSTDAFADSFIESNVDEHALDEAMDMAMDEASSEPAEDVAELPEELAPQLNDDEQVPYTDEERIALFS
ncbi:MAG: protein phosphatase CheZ [Devosiaceae bacterium]